MDSKPPQDARPTPEDARTAMQDARPPAEHAAAASDSRDRATRARRALDVVLLLGPIWLLTAATAPAVGLMVFTTIWSGNGVAILLALVAGSLVLTLAISLAAYPGRSLIRSGDNGRGRLRWAAGVCLYGTILVLIAGFLWRQAPAAFGSGPTRMWLVGAIYALTAATRTRPRVLRNLALAALVAAAVLAVILAVHNAPNHG